MLVPAALFAETKALHVSEVIPLVRIVWKLISVTAQRMCAVIP